MNSHAILRHVARFLAREDGPTTVEYAVLLSMIATVCIGAITTLGQNANGSFGTLSQLLQDGGSTLGKSYAGGSTVSSGTYSTSWGSGTFSYNATSGKLTYTSASGSSVSGMLTPGRLPNLDGRSWTKTAL